MVLESDSLADLFDISPPAGFKMVSLGEIASLKMGLNAVSYKSLLSEAIKLFDPNQSYLLTPKNILANGNIDLDNASKFNQQEFLEKTSKDKLDDNFLVQPNDILISRILTKTNASIAMVPDNLPGSIAFADSVIRVRVNAAMADARYVFDFLRSDTGWLLLQRFASSLAGMPRISLSGLAETPIFLPEGKTANGIESLSAVAITLRRIKDEIIPELQHLDEGKDKLDNQLKDRDVDLQRVATQLRQLAATLAPSPLAERVVEKYPTPIAIAYRRFHDSRFNVYERIQRLRDLFEISLYFIYNLVLADLLQRLDPERFYIKDRGARRAYGGFAMSKRIDLVREVIRIAKTDRGAELFMPELVASALPESAEKLKDLRNHLSHTATSTESKLRKLLSESEPMLDDLLLELEFLTSYRLVRIPSFFCRNGQFIYRMEVYQGAVPYLDERPVDNDSQLEALQQAEYNHLIMLNNEGHVLDLYPMLQLVDSEATQYESHICFLKQCKVQEKILEGESIQNSIALHLDGFEDFEKMKGKILDEPSKP